MTSKGHKSNVYNPRGYTDESTNSASLAQAQRLIKHLEEENKQLKEELTELKVTYIQLTKEAPQEKFDERRVTFLKAQLIQLERQILLLNEALGTRMAVLVEAENSLGVISETCKNYLQEEGRIGEVYITKDDLKQIIHAAESARSKLHKNIENTSMQRLHKPLQFMETFIKASHQSQTTLLDVCTGKMEHINLKQVAKLESKLCQVYKQLLAVNECLTLQVFPEEAKDKTQQSKQITVPQAPKANFVKLYGESSRACCLLNELLPDLLELSVLVPAAPLPVLKKCIVRELTVDNVMSKLPVLSKSKSQESREVIEALLKVLSLIQLKSNTQEKVYKEELKFHKSVYQLQLDYIDNLFKAMRIGYKSFEEDSNNLICKPLKEVLRIYETLQTTASEDALRLFLKVFKESHLQIAEAVEKLEVQEKGEDALSGFGDEFFDKLHKLETECQADRDDNILKLQGVKEQQEEYWSEIKRMFYVDEEELQNNKNVQYSGRKSKQKRTNSPRIDNSYSDSSDHPPFNTSAYNFQYEKEPLPVIKSPDILTPKRSSKKLTHKNREHQDSSRNESERTRHDVQAESEALFMATLRGGYDDNDRGFVFDSPRSETTPQPKEDFKFARNNKSRMGEESGSKTVNESSILHTDEDSTCTCGADEHQHFNHDHLTSVKHNKTRTFNVDSKPPASSTSRPPVSSRTYNNSPKTSTGKLMKGVPRAKLSLKTRARSLDNASDSENETTVRSPGRPLSRSGSLSKMDKGDCGVQKEVSFPVDDSSMRKRSGSLPRSKPPVPHWK